MGQNSVPLSYGIRENPESDYDGKNDKEYDFERFSINCPTFSESSTRLICVSNTS